MSHGWCTCAGPRALGFSVRSDKVLDFKPTYCQSNGWTPLTFAVEDATKPGTTLVVEAD